MAIEVGNKAPSFTLPNHAGDAVSLDKFRGKWLVLYFYPKDDTPGCTVEACEFTAGVRDFQGLNAEVAGVSPDSPVSHTNFREKFKLRVHLLSDADKSVLREYGAWGTKKMYGREVEGVIRSTVLVDPEGIVRHHWKNVRSEGHAKAVRQRLADLQKPSD